MKEIPCGCCEGIEKLTPLATANRPGLGALRYRIGTHATFLETMLARLSNLCLCSEDDRKEGKGRYPLQDLKTRERSDPAIALLDAWATVADVLTFYQELLANEGYLRTATERRSILELARLVGYELRPGVASSVYLAYALEDNFNDEVIIPKGARSQSVPGPGELPQSFETSEDLKTRARWNNLKPRTTQPQQVTPPGNNLDSSTEAPNIRTLYFRGTATNLKPNDPLLIDFGTQQLYRVQDVTADTLAERTKVTAQRWLQIAVPTGKPTPSPVATLPQILPALEKPPSTRPPNSLRLPRSIDQAFAAKADTAPQLLTTLRPELSSILYEAMANLPVTPAPVVQVYVLRTRASVFGHNAPLEPIKNTDGVVIGFKEWDLKRSTGVATENFSIITTLSIHSDTNIIRRISTHVEIQQDEVDSKDKELNQSPFFIDLLTALDKIKVSIMIGFHDETSVKYEFQNRPLVISVTFGPKGSFTASSEGSDPTTVITADISESESKITINGIRQMPSISQTTEQSNIVFLDAPYEQIIPGGWIVLERPNPLPSYNTPLVISRVKEVGDRSRADYGITGKSTRVQLDRDWLNLEDNPKDDFSVIRGTSVFAQSELLELAEEPIDPIEKAICGEEIELEGVYDGLESGRWVFVSGERTDVIATSQQSTNTADSQLPVVRVNSVPASELVMLAGFEQDFNKNLLGDKTHSRLLLAKPGLAYCYKRDTVTIYGNVVKATHGETRKEVLGSGDGAKALQSFTLKQPPLTFVSAPNPAGVDSTLKVFVNDVQWHEADALAGLSPTDRRFITRTDDDSKTTVIFGNGQGGARLPTGLENIKAEYRNGIGKPGNVKAEQISLLASKPLGVKGVINPLRASGGADREDRDQARKNAPLAVTALDRLVSVRDYEDFARTFAGIGKASATELSDGHRRLVHLTIAGVDDIPIDETSDLFRNLRQALHDFGDAAQAFHVAVRELMLLVISARVRILPDYQWEPISTQLRAVLLDAFGFERRELGQDVLLSEVISVMQAVRGVAYVDVDALDALDEDTIVKNLPDPGKSSGSDDLATRLKLKPRPRIPVEVARIDPIRPAQIAYLTPDVPDTLILNEVPL